MSPPEALKRLPPRGGTHPAAWQSQRVPKYGLLRGRLTWGRVALMRLLQWLLATGSFKHGGNGYALEFEISRVLCDARILNIFEGAAEIQAQVVGRGWLAR